MYIYIYIHDYRYIYFKRGKRTVYTSPKMKSIRKEYRMLSKKEIHNLHKAMNALKQRMIDNISVWDLFTYMHYPDNAPGAHWGPAFLPWHREFLRKFEVALQKELQGVSLPYWDSTLDHGLPEPSDSILWTDFMLGNGNGFVKTGPFADWNANTDMPLSPVSIKKLYRSVGGREFNRLLSVRDVNWIERRQHYRDLTFCHDKTFESMHGLSHAWVGGYMYVLRVSPNDPAFYLHHAFIDYLWERFRIKRQTRYQRENDYATKICDNLQALNATMIPFNITNKEGLSNEYTDKWYEYEPVRHCYELDPYCKSKFYFCDRRVWRCRSKIQIGGNCTGFSDFDICYKSESLSGDKEEKHVLKSNVKKNEIVYAKTVLIGKSGLPLTDPRCYVEIRNMLKNGDIIRNYVEKSIKSPEIPGLIYLTMPKPHTGLSQIVQLEARDQYGRYCQMYCYNISSDNFDVCEPKITIDVRFPNGTNLSYTHSASSRKYLDVDLSFHPSKITIRTPNIVFLCTTKLLAQIEVRDENNKNNWRSSIQQIRSIDDFNIIFVRVPNPFATMKLTSIKISITQDGKKVNCDTKCLSMKKCDATVNLSTDASFSDEQIFTTDRSMIEVLGWNMTGHPSLWTHKMTYLNFYC
ncbi:unnamed protein product [Dracunculus medinensis]|uniref:Tyrosinase copper-binding domain-containing protein n=1 Tax=Dracunculus medinensis TaxID=318479 RepID=A0A3P7PY95_DRAME|nr:unnamed protein product [Dracunculus medinensis]